MSGKRAILQLMLTPGLGSRTLADLLSRAANLSLDPESIADATTSELIDQYNLRRAVASAVAAQHESAAALADQLDEHDIDALTIGSPLYPQRLQQTLQRDAPPILFTRGNLGLLKLPAIAIAGSRKAAPSSLAATRSAGATLATAGLNVVSGYANGVDLTAHTAALEAGGVTTMTLAEGILHFRAKSEISDYLDSKNHLIVSEFPPTLRWIARNAMKRNRTIIGLSSALLIVESGEDGGTFAAGEEALTRRTQLFVMRYADSKTTPSGNETLIRRGGQPVTVNQVGEIDLGTVLESCFSVPDQPGGPNPQQDTLW